MKTRQLTLVVDNGSPRRPHVRPPRGESRENFERDARNAPPLRSVDNSHPVFAGDAIAEVPLLHGSRLDPAISGEVGSARPSSDNVSKVSKIAHHEETVRWVPPDVNTHCTDEAGRLDDMDLPHLNAPGERLRWARLRKGIPTPTQAARTFQWNVETYKKTESGERGMTESKAKRYGRMLGVDWRWLMHGRDAYTGDRYSPDEISLLEKYRRKGPAAREAAHQVLDAFPDTTEKAG